MTILTVRGHEVDVDIEDELESYVWEGARWSADKLIACSPFRSDRSPSFYVNIHGEYAGVWGDSGAETDEYEKGGFVKLIALLNDWVYEDAEDYLIERYGVLYEDVEDIVLPEIVIEDKASNFVEIDESRVTCATSTYLLSRGITEEVQRQCNVGYGDGRKGYTAIPWYTADGRMANVKYRSTRGKDFYYEGGATPVSSLVYGLDIVNYNGHKTAILCEGEIDSMSWMTAFFPSIAVGSASINEVQADAIKRSSIERLILGGDNDKQGRRLNDKARRMLEGYVELFEIDYGRYSDANDVLKAEGGHGLRSILRDKKALGTFEVNL